MTKPFEPMLAFKLKPEHIPQLRFPLIIQPKFDGIRCCVIDGVAKSRTLKRIPNDYIRAQLFELWKDCSMPYLIDGELLVGNNFQDSTSGIMTKQGKPNFRFKVFDYAQNVDSLKAAYIERFYYAEINSALNSFTVANLTVYLQEHLDYFIGVAKAQKSEGIILRYPNEPYHFGRTTFNQHALMAIKHFEDGEAIVTGFEPRFKNMNPKQDDAFFRTKRSSHQDNMKPTEFLGSFICLGISGEFKDVIFKVGTGIGMTDEFRKEVWMNQDKYFGKQFTYQYQKIGSKNKPRILTFKGWRLDI